MGWAERFVGPQAHSTLKLLTERGSMLRLFVMMLGGWALPSSWTQEIRDSCLFLQQYSQESNELDGTAELSGLLNYPSCTCYTGCKLFGSYRKTNED